MMPKRKSVIQQVIVLLAVYATFCSWPAVSGSLTGSAEKLIDEKLRMESLFKAAESTPPTLTASKPGSLVAPPVPYEDHGACPFECCTYRRWIATKDTAIRQDRKENSPTLFNVNKGEWVTAVTGVVITTVSGKAQVLRPTTINGIPVKNGEIVYILTYQGEGVYEIWYKGKKWEPYPDMSTLGIMERPESTWWVQIKNNKGQIGWSNESDNFDNRDACGGDIEEPPVLAGGAVMPQPRSSAVLLSRIDKALSRLPKPSDYLYETTSVQGQIVGTWTEMTADILGTRELRVAYDNFYQSSVEYAGMVEINLLRARKAALNNDAETANRLFEMALRYERQFYLNDKAAIEAFNGNIDAAAELARGIYEGSKAATIYGSSMVLGPVGSRVVDTVFDATDFAVEASDNGLTSAANKLVADKLTEMIFSYATVTTLGGRTLEDAIDRGVAKTLGSPEVYRIVREVVSKPEFAKAFMGFMAKSGSHMVSSLTEDQVNKIVMVVMEGIASKIPSLTDCGSKWYQHLGLQFLEVSQASVIGFSFNKVCQAHDACYADCRKSKPECDKKLLTDAQGVCESAWNRAICISSAQTFFLAVSKFGDTPFKQAQANCPAIKDAIMNPQYLGGTVDAGTHPLDDATIKSMITNRLKDYIPIDLIGNYMSGTNGVVEEIEVLEKSYEKEQLNAIGKAFFGEPKNYWGVVVRVKGHGQVGFNSMVAGMMSGDPDSKRSFNSKTKYRFYDAGGGSWNLVSPEELRP